MNETVSFAITVQKKYSFQRMLEIHQAVKKINGSVYLYSKQKQINAFHLTKLVSFLLTVEPGTTVLLQIHGQDERMDTAPLLKLLENATNSPYPSCTKLTESPDSFTY